MSKKKKVLLMFLPVIHRGYLDVLKNQLGQLDSIVLFDKIFVNKLVGFEPSIESIDYKSAKILLSALGFDQVEQFNIKNISKFKSDDIFLINDEFSRLLSAKYFSGLAINWLNVFLRWDRKNVFSEEVTATETSANFFDKKMMKLAYQQAKNSGDWWRQVGAVLVKNKTVLFKGYNQGVPNDHSPYQQGAVRDVLKVGERPDLANYIHAEQLIISQAAKEGKSLEGASLYITHFPCSMCAKLIAFSGIKKLYFSEGSANLEGLQVIKSRKLLVKKVRS